MPTTTDTFLPDRLGRSKTQGAHHIRTPGVLAQLLIGNLIVGMT